MATGCASDEAESHLTQTKRKPEARQTSIVFPEHRKIKPGESFLHFFPTPKIKKDRTLHNAAEKVLPLSQGMFRCEKCGGDFGKKAGLSRHLNSCKASQLKTKNEVAAVINKTENKMTSHLKNNLIIDIPAPLPTLDTDLPCLWGNHTSHDLAQIFNAMYNETTRWKKNLFNIPSGAAGK